MPLYRFMEKHRDAILNTIDTLYTIGLILFILAGAIFWVLFIGMGIVTVIKNSVLSANQVAILMPALGALIATLVLCGTLAAIRTLMRK